MPATNAIPSTLRIVPGVENPLVEQEIVQRARSGDATAVRDLYLCHHEKIYRFIWSRVQDADLADDLTGEVFIRMVQSLPQYQDRSQPFRAWLYGITRNLLVDHFRRSGLRQSVPLRAVEASLPDGETLEERTDQALTLQQVRRALARLAPDEREVVELRFLAGLSLKETADVVQKSLAAVKAIQHRGLAALRASIPTREGA